MVEVYGISGDNKCKREVIPGKIYQVTVKSFPPEGIAAGSVVPLTFNLSPYLDEGMKVSKNVIVLGLSQAVYDSASSQTVANSGTFVKSDRTYPRCSALIDNTIVTVYAYNNESASRYGVSATLTFLVTNIHNT